MMDSEKTLIHPQPYFSPSGTKYTWHNGGLKHLPRHSRVVPFPSNGSIYAQLQVYSYSDGTHQGTVTFFDWRNNYVKACTPFLKEELHAFLKAEELVDSWVATFPTWMSAALAEGWRSPIFKRREGLSPDFLDLDKG